MLCFVNKVYGHLITFYCLVTNYSIVILGRFDRKHEVVKRQFKEG